MKTKRVESLEDLVFRNRNKLYGAYFLHRRYSRYVYLALIVAVSLLLSAIAYPLIVSVRFKGFVRPGEVTVRGDIMKPPPADITPPPPPPPPPAEVLQNKVKFVAPKIVDNDSVDENFGRQDLLALKKSTELPPPDDSFIPDDKAKPRIIEVPEKAEPLTWVEEMPAYPGGETELYRYLKSILAYPAEAKESSISGTVYLTFVVESDGSISGIRVLRGIGGGCDEKAVRVVKSMPSWMPGRQNGIAVRVRFNLPVKFTLQ